MRGRCGLVLRGDPVDPGQHLGDPGVDPRVLLLGAPDAPAHDPDLLAVAAEGAGEQRPAGVSLHTRHHHQTVARVKPRPNANSVYEQTTINRDTTWTPDLCSQKQVQVCTGVAQL